MQAITNKVNYFELQNDDSVIKITGFKKKQTKLVRFAV